MAQGRSVGQVKLRHAARVSRLLRSVRGHRGARKMAFRAAASGKGTSKRVVGRGRGGNGSAEVRSKVHATARNH